MGWQGVCALLKTMPTRKEAATKYFMTEFMVEGYGEFPLDMLRYDCATFMSSTDVVEGGKTGNRKVRLKRFYSAGSIAEPTVSRWASFGWTVKPIDL